MQGGTGYQINEWIKCVLKNNTRLLCFAMHTNSNYYVYNTAVISYNYISIVEIFNYFHFNEWTSTGFLYYITINKIFLKHIITVFEERLI